MTDITELAQREKFEAWARSQKLSIAYGDCGYVYSSTEMAWRAVKALSAELVEALEKAQTINAAAEKLVRCKGRYHSEQNYRALAALFGVTTPDLPPLEHENVNYADAAEMEIAALRQRIAKLESRTVTVKLPDYRNIYKGTFADEVEHQVRRALDLFSADAGIKWEAE
ncbi:TPA: ead/Ea22-like family protein [Raoultella ornithinolytica]|nr:ead/Ea22-like family protein [Raoultella ornithinolytica]